MAAVVAVVVVRHAHSVITALASTLALLITARAEEAAAVVVRSIARYPYTHARGGG